MFTNLRRARDLLRRRKRWSASVEDIALTATFSVFHRPKLTENDIRSLAGLCAAKATEHLFCPNGTPERATSWLQLQERLTAALHDEKVSIGASPRAGRKS